jgi:hypothetical protein
VRTRWFVKSVRLRHICWKIDIWVCADCGGTWQVLERVIISLGDKLYRLSLAKLLCVNKNWHWEQLLVVFCPEVEKIQFWNTGGILYCIPEHRSCQRIISVWETCICLEFRVCSSLLFSLKVRTLASKQALHLLKICMNIWWCSCLEIWAVSLWMMFIINAKEPCQNVLLLHDWWLNSVHIFETLKHVHFISLTNWHTVLTECWEGYWICGLVPRWKHFILQPSYP